MTMTTWIVMALLALLVLSPLLWRGRRPARHRHGRDLRADQLGIRPGRRVAGGAEARAVGLCARLQAEPGARAPRGYRPPRGLARSAAETRGDRGDHSDP